MTAETAPAPVGQSVDEPYVGPRPFERGDADRFFGRSSEIRELLSLVVAHRVVLLYAASGAGKTSLLSAGVAPLLEVEEGFDVLPIARVRGLAADGAVPEGAPNVYVSNLLSHWGVADGRHPSIKSVLKARKRPTSDGFPAPRALIVDQLEELFTLYPEHWRQRGGYFEQLAAALDADPLLRVVLAIREDYVAQLDPYAAILGGLRTRFRLERLGYDAALQAVTRPLEETDRSFAEGVAELLVEDLQRVRVETGAGESVEVEGEFVEPVQLQVACHSLWSALPAGVNEITEEHLATFGDVDEVLSAYYATAVAAAAKAAKVREGRLRDRLEEVFITPMGTRGTAYGTPESTAGVPSAAIDELESRHVLRAERTRGARWYELTHDRLIEPIRASNREARSRRTQRRMRWAAGTAAGALAVAAVVAGTTLAFTGSEAPAAAPGGQQAKRDLANQELAQRSLVSILKAGSPLADASFSPDGRFAVTAARNGDATVWDVVSGQSLLTLPGEGRLTSASFDPAGGRLLTTSDDGTVRMWNWTRLASLLGQPVRIQTEQRRLGVEPDGILGRATIAALKRNPAVSSLFLDSDEASALAGTFSPDGKYLATGQADGTARILKAGNAEPQATLRDDFPVRSVAFAADGRRLVTAGESGAVVWDWRARKKIRTLLRTAGTQYAAFGPLGLLLVTDSGTAQIWSDIEKLTELRPPSPIVAAAFAPKGRQLAAGLADGTIRIWDLRAVPGQIFASLLVELGGHRGAVTSVAFSPDGNFVVTSGLDGTARVWRPFGDVDVVRPLPTDPGLRSEFTVSTGGGAPTNDGRRLHAAKDWFAPAGTPLRAPVSGRIVEAKPRKAQHGGTVKILASDGKVWVFREIQPNHGIAGKSVRRGDVVAKVVAGSSGTAYVHIEVWKTLEGGYDFENMLDPMIFLRRFAGSRG